jgi:gliding motility-associated-like protein
MRRLITILALLAICLLITTITKAQISASVTEGCAPLASVQFTNSYTNPTGINWNFGDGASSNLPNPTKSFANAGTYTVTFTATVDGAAVSAELTITVYENPIAQFTVSPDGVCLGDALTFSDQSIGGNGTDIIQWEWDYGNGTAGEFGPNPSFTYAVSGAYQVTLLVTDENGCSESSTVNQAAIVSIPPTVSVMTDPSPANACEAPFEVSFTNNSTNNSPVGGELTYDWDFGNGESSNSEDPAAVTYTENGTYTITVTATDEFGCASSQTIPVSVQEPTASISIVGNEDGIVCNPIEIELEGTEGGIFFYGDGTAGTVATHTYGTEGDYTINYTVNSGGCSAEASVDFFVEVPTGTITSIPGFACSVPAEFQYFLETDYDVVDFSWNVSVGGATPLGLYQSNEESPIFLIDYEAPDTFSVNPIVFLTGDCVFTTENGCEASLSIESLAFDTIALPNSLIFPDVNHGCAPLTVNFDNESFHIFNSELESAEWHWGDGAIETTDNPTAGSSYTYNEAGEYNAFLVIFTEQGCTDTSFIQTIEVGEPVSPTFEVSPEVVCRGEEVTITNTSSAFDLIDGYSYTSDQNTWSSCPDEESSIFIFDDFAGEAIITQYADYNGCLDSSMVMLTVEGPVGHVSYGCNCDTPLDYTFTAEVFDAESWTWDFGDGTVIENSTELMVSHVYEETGDYQVILTTFNNNTDCGSHIDEVTVKVRDLNAVISMDSLLCAGVFETISAVETQDIAGSNGGCYRNYLWDFGDGTRPIKTTNGSVSHIFSQGGDFTVSLNVKDDNECVFTTTKDIRAFEIEADYTADTLYGCLPLEVNFEDLSFSDTTIVEWEWDFDIGGEMSDVQNPVFTYNDVEFDNQNNPIPYQVSLQVTDALGCVANISSLVIEPLAPNPEFTNTSSNQICVGDEVSFSPTGTNPAFHSYEWDFGNGTTSDDALTESIYNEAGTYSVSLVVTDSLGCFREEIQEIVFVQDYPIAIIGTNFEEDENLCYPFVATYSNESVNANPAGYTWQVEQIGTINNQPSVGTTYLEPGFYDVSLTSQTTFGCISDTSITVEVEGPLAEINLNPNAICPGGSIELLLTDTSDLAFWEFDFGDGSASANEWITQHTYDPTFIPTTGSTVLTLVMFSADSACSSARTENLIIEEVVADFDRNNEFSILDSIHCVGPADEFISTSSPNATSFFWTISNGESFNTQNVTTTLEPGEYEVELIVNSDLGCADTIAKSMEIFALPTASVNEGEICRGESITLTAEGGISYSWNPVSGLDNPNAGTVQASPNSNTLYTVTVTDENNCSATTQSFVLVYQPPPSISVDTVLRIGNTDIAGLNLGQGYTYQWSPDLELECDTCPTTLFRPLESREYTLSISDTVGCFTIDSYFYFEILEVASVVVPDAFTPNGDGVNDIVYVEGWGIEELISFQIYNRWGELIFETNDSNEGWDGTYKGELQNPDSYAYVVVAKNFIFGNPETFKGFIDLVK